MVAEVAHVLVHVFAFDTRHQHINGQPAHLAPESSHTGDGRMRGFHDLDVVEPAEAKFRTDNDAPAMGGELHAEGKVVVVAKDRIGFGRLRQKLSQQGLTERDA